MGAATQAFGTALNTIGIGKVFSGAKKLYASRRMAGRASENLSQLGGAKTKTVQRTFGPEGKSKTVNVKLSNSRELARRRFADAKSFNAMKEIGEGAARLGATGLVGYGGYKLLSNRDNE